MRTPRTKGSRDEDDTDHSVWQLIGKARDRVIRGYNQFANHGGEAEKYTIRHEYSNQILKSSFLFQCGKAMLANSYV
jgi:hypothetical protein